MQSSQTGQLLPFAQRPYPHHFFVLPIKMPAQTTQTVYMRVQTGNTMNVPVRLWSRVAFDSYERDDYVSQALYFGMVLAMALFNLLLFLALRDVNYLLYVAFVASIALTMAAFNGLAYEFLWNNSPMASTAVTFIGPSVAMMTLLLFTRRMLNTAALMPRLDIGLNICMAFNLLAPLGLFFSFAHTIKPGYVLVALTTSLILLSGIVGAIQRQRSAYFFVIAFAALCVALFMAQLRGFGLAPNQETTTNYIQLGSAIEMLLLAFALADRFNVLRQEKEQAQTAALRAQQAAVQTLQTSERLLEARVNARTLELTTALEHLQRTRDDLLQAEKLASLGALVAGVAHELNTPIGNALTTASTLQHRLQAFGDTVSRGELRRTALDDVVRDGQEMADLITRSCERAGQLISSFKQVAVDQTSEQRRNFDLRTLVEDNIDALRPSFKRAPWVIEIDIPNGLDCDSYPGPLGQVIANLVQNAALHGLADRPSGRLQISARAVDDCIELRVEDNGKGMDPTTLAHIFEPFFTTRLGQGGSGLGLSVSHNIATGMLGGHLTASSEPEQGSCFVLRFPKVAPALARRHTDHNMVVSTT
jgi:signal transduction histidine kinase